MGISTLTHTFEAANLDKDCTIPVVCVAINSDGRSEHHYILSPGNTDSCPRDTDTDTDTEMPTLEPPVIVLNEPEVGGIEGTNESSKKSNTFWIIIGAIVIAATCIVVGVCVLLLCFIKHFSTKNK